MKTEIFPLSTGFMLVRIKGRVDHYTAPLLEEELDTLTRSGQHNLIVDLSDAEHISSEGIKVLAEIKNFIAQYKGELVLFCPSRQVKKVLVFVGLENYFKTYFKAEELTGLNMIDRESEKIVKPVRRTGILKVNQSPESDLQDIELYDGTQLTIGRGKNNRVYLSHPTVSRNHARIKVSNGKVTIADAGSTNGTAVNRKKIKGEVELNDKDKIEIGEYTFIFLR